MAKKGKKIQDRFSKVKSPQFRFQLRMNAMGLCVCGRKLKTKRHCQICAGKHNARVKRYQAAKKAKKQPKLELPIKACEIMQPPAA